MRQLDLIERECEKTAYQGEDEISHLFDIFNSSILLPSLEELTKNLTRFFLDCEDDRIDVSLLLSVTGSRINRLHSRILRVLSWFLSNCYPNDWPSHFIETCWSYILYVPPSSNDTNTTDQKNLHQSSRSGFSFRWTFFFFRESLLIRGLTSILADLQSQISEVNDSQIHLSNVSRSPVESPPFDMRQSSGLDLISFAPPNTSADVYKEVIDRLTLAWILNVNDTEISFKKFLPLLTVVHGLLFRYFFLLS